MNYLILFLIFIAVDDHSFAQEKNKVDSTVLESTVEDTKNSNYKISYKKPDIKDLLHSKEYTGYIKLYHPTLKRLVYDGEIKNGRFYQFDNDDLLIWVLRFKNGEYQVECQGI